MGLIAGLAACATPSPPRNRPTDSSKQMRIAGKIVVPDPTTMTFASGSVWILSRSNGDPSQEPVLRVDPASNKIVAAFGSAGGGIPDGGWQFAENTAGLWIAI